MRYMMLIYSHENEAATPEDMARGRRGPQSVMDEARAAGIFCAADPLQPSVDRHHRSRAGRQVTGHRRSFAETKEQLAGYYILDCQDLDEALTWAAKIPTACAGAAGCIEIRPLREFPSRPCECMTIAPPSNPFSADESGRIIAGLIRVSRSFDLAEEAMQDAFAAAVVSWQAEVCPITPPPGSRPPLAAS